MSASRACCTSRSCSTSAGGLSADNVGQALGALGDLLPWGVDVATGVEGASHRKDAALLAAFVAAVRKAERA